MTIPNPDPRALLDALDEAHAKATPGPWLATSPRADGGAYIDPPRPRQTSDGVCWVGHTEAHADAALIVAAVNALPALTAAVRAALDALRLIDQFGCTNLTRGRCSDDPSRTRDAAYTADRWCEGCIAAAAIATVTAALTGGQA